MLTAGVAEVDVWLTRLDGRDMDALRSHLSPDELTRGNGYQTADAARRYTAARATLRQILANRLHCAPDDVPFEYGKSGKPALAGALANTLKFNLSHSGECAAFAICTSAEVGIDIEYDDLRIDPAELLGVVCTPQELPHLRNSSDKELRESFFRLWTRKEAYLKCIGYGLRIEPNTLEMPLDGESDVCAGSGDSRCSIRTIMLLPDLHVSVAARSPAIRLQSIQWWPSRAPLNVPFSNSLPQDP